MPRGSGSFPPDIPPNARSALLEAILDALPVAVAVWSLPPGASDPGDLTLVAWNKTAAGLSRVGGANPVGLSMREMNNGIAATPYGAMLVRAIVHGESTHVHRMLRPDADGTERYFDWRATPVAGSVAVVALDVTAGARAEQAAATFQALAEAAPVSLLVWRLDDPEDPGSFVLEQANRAAAKVTGLSVEAMVGRRIGDLYPDAVTSGRAALYVEIAQGRHPAESRTVTYRTGSGEVHETLLEAFPVPGGRLGMSGMIIPRGRRV
jgi:PAS domain S-box-containing protein